MASPQTGNGYVRIANEIWDEVIRRDFSKRQKDILFFIWRLSYGCNKRTAYVPQMKSFELCGVSRTKIKDELTHLEKSRVLIWNKDEKLFEINKDYESWFISLVKSWDEREFQELISTNIVQNKFPKREFEIPKTGIEENEEFPKGELKVPKTGIGSSQNGNLSVPETGIATHDETNNDAASEFSKDSIKDNIKDNKSCCLEEPVQFVSEKEYRKKIADKYLQRRGKGLDLSPNDESVVDGFISKKIPLHIVLDGIDQAFDKFKPKNDYDEINSLNYCSRIIFPLFAQHSAQAEKEPEVNTMGNEDLNDQYSDEEVQKMLAELRAKRGEAG